MSDPDNRRAKVCILHGQVQGILTWGTFAAGLIWGIKCLPRTRTDNLRIVGIVSGIGFMTKFMSFAGFKYWLQNDCSLRRIDVSVQSYPPTTYVRDAILPCLLYRIIAKQNKFTNEASGLLNNQRDRQNYQIDSFIDSLKTLDPNFLQDKHLILRNNVRRVNINIDGTDENLQQLLTKLQNSKETTSQYISDLQTLVETLQTDISKQAEFCLWYMFPLLGGLFLFDKFSSIWLRKESIRRSM